MAADEMADVSAESEGERRGGWYKLPNPTFRFAPPAERSPVRRLQHEDVVTRTADVFSGALVGMVGGLLAAGAMSLGHSIVERAMPKPSPPTPAPDDATVQVARATLRAVGLDLEESDEPLAGTLVHYAFGASVGGLYGAAAEIAPRVTFSGGVPFGVAVWLGAHVAAVPALGLADPPTRRPLRREMEELGLHLVFGLTLELVRRLLRR
jgi:uncharacterized membrane protein YagU involved in acid resistance